MANFLSVLGSLGFSFESIILFAVLFFFYIKLNHKIELSFKLLSKDFGYMKGTLDKHEIKIDKLIQKEKA